MEMYITSEAIAECCGTTSGTIIQWMYRFGRKGMARHGYRYEDAADVITYYRDTLHRVVDCNRLPEGLKTMLTTSHVPRCPYCDSEMKVMRNFSSAMWFTKCSRCGSTSPIAVNKDEAIMMAIR